MEATLMKFMSRDGEYLVLDTSMNHLQMDGHAARVICSRNFGVGTRGLLVGNPGGNGEDMRCFNPDGDRVPMDDCARKVARSCAGGGARAEWMDASACGDHPYMTGKIFLTDRFIRNNHLCLA